MYGETRDDCDYSFWPYGYEVDGLLGYAGPRTTTI